MLRYLFPYGPAKLCTNDRKREKEGGPVIYGEHTYIQWEERERKRQTDRERERERKRKFI